MSSFPDIDPYAVLGVSKGATLSEIKAAHRKRVLKCHPDKVLDESQREKAQDEFQKVQQAYELLSDDATRQKYDRLAELRREVRERSAGATGSSPYSSPRTTTREYWNGRYYEERAPADAASAEEDVPLAEEPWPSFREYDEAGKRQRSKFGMDGKRRTRTYPAPGASSFEMPKQTTRESSRAYYSDRAKTRTKERQREASEKYERTAHYDDEDDEDDASDSSASVYIRVKRPSGSRKTHSDSAKAELPSLRRAATEPSRKQETRRYDDDEYTDGYDRHDYRDKLANACDHIRRTKIEVDRQPRASRSPPRHHVFETGEPEMTSRRSRPSARSREGVRPSTSRNSSYEHLESQAPSFEPKVPPTHQESTSPSARHRSSSRPSLPRSATSYGRTTWQRFGRAHHGLYGMVDETTLPHDTPPTRSSKARSGLERHDSGYSSPGTPDVAPETSPPKVSSKRCYKVVEQETIVLEADKPSMPSRHQRSYSPVRQERTPGSARSSTKSSRSSTAYVYPSEASRYDSRSKSSKMHFGEFEQLTKEKDPRISRVVGPDDGPYGYNGYSRHAYDSYHNPVGRRAHVRA
ncbi:hypothetical protein MPDQ_001188 [Monascus purpureus]|uniref:J domain-containing protein n=1 Tax=Monascus purpureus TaxID=5098 RepID=A0A507R3E2_MONPU|nr:hypothetical protein MPDQ_001188 [Monascus purpureus]BDD61416.1 hypothetical protein MAP00_006460 [Monascus purpureus]